MLFALELSRPPKAFDQKLAAKAAKYALAEAGITAGEARVGVLFVSEEKIKALNSKWRKKRTATDVLSFYNYERLPLKKEHFLDLGDIYICSSIAKKQMVNHKLSLGHELLLLYVHGVLHLLGLDHEKLSDEKKMFRLQELILSKVGVRYNPKDL